MSEGSVSGARGIRGGAPTVGRWRRSGIGGYDTDDASDLDRIPLRYVQTPALGEPCTEKVGFGAGEFCLPWIQSRPKSDKAKSRYSDGKDCDCLGQSYRA
jgi:hypothetical protein